MKMEYLSNCVIGFAPFAFILLIVVILGMLIDPQGMADWAKDLKKFYFDDEDGT